MSLILAVGLVRMAVAVFKEFDDPTSTSSSTPKVIANQKHISLTYCSNCNKEMTQLYYGIKPTNEYQCNCCRKKVIVNS